MEILNLESILSTILHGFGAFFSAFGIFYYFDREKNKIPFWVVGITIVIYLIVLYTNDKIGWGKGDASWSLESITVLAGLILGIQVAKQFTREDKKAKSQEDKEDK